MVHFEEERRARRGRSGMDGGKKRSLGVGGGMVGEFQATTPGEARVWLWRVEVGEAASAGARVQGKGGLIPDREGQGVCCRTF